MINEKEIRKSKRWYKKQKRKFPYKSRYNSKVKKGFVLIH